jgi:hypothetical protein
MTAPVVVRTDTERLDWLDKAMLSVIWYWAGGWVVSTGKGQCFVPSLRTAIDLAIDTAMREHTP